MFKDFLCDMESDETQTIHTSLSPLKVSRSGPIMSQNEHDENDTEDVSALQWSFVDALNVVGCSVQMAIIMQQFSLSVQTGGCNWSQCTHLRATASVVTPCLQG
jgi:hypothetical protein